MAIWNGRHVLRNYSYQVGEKEMDDHIKFLIEELDPDGHVVSVTEHTAYPIPHTTDRREFFQFLHNMESQAKEKNDG
jgi:hypothetical protein